MGNNDYVSLFVNMNLIQFLEQHLKRVYWILYLFKSYLFIYLCITVLGLCCDKDFSLVSASGGYCIVTVCGLFIAVAFLVAEHWL